MTRFISAISCKDEEGVDIDSWTIMKLPKSTDYFYYEANGGMSQSAYSLNDTSAGALSYTMWQLWKEPDVEYMLYNDEPPNQTAYNFSVAHSKGVWMWDSKSAVVITHSIPKFPSGPGEGGWYTGLEQNAWEYGQAASCFQVSADYLETALASIQLTAPLIYERRCSDCYGRQPSKALRGGGASNPCNVSLLDDGRILFMKPSTLQVDIWASCISPYFASDARVESWIHGTTDGAFCPPEYAFETTDIQSLAFPNGKTVIEYDDHSKWGVLESPIVCFGDLNRVTTQMQRAGTVYCWKDGALWSQLDGMIQETNSC